MLHCLQLHLIYRCQYLQTIIELACTFAAICFMLKQPVARAFASKNRQPAARNSYLEKSNHERDQECVYAGCARLVDRSHDENFEEEAGIG